MRRNARGGASWLIWYFAAVIIIVKDGSGEQALFQNGLTNFFG